MNHDLTPRQTAILRYIREFQSEHGYPPTMRQIGAEFDIKSPNGVQCNLVALERKGAIVRDKKAARGIRLVENGPALEDEVAALRMENAELRKRLQECGR